MADPFDMNLTDEEYAAVLTFLRATIDAYQEKPPNLPKEKSDAILFGLMKVFCMMVECGERRT